MAFFAIMNPPFAHFRHKLSPPSGHRRCVLKQPDRIDEKILAIMQSNNQLTCNEMAERISISPSSCRRRIDALRRNGTIVADVSIVNPEVLGERLIVIALVTLERDTPDGHAAFRRAMQDLPQVLDCEYVAGHCDYVVRFKLASMTQYDSLADQYFTADPAVKRVDSLVVMKAVKGRHELFTPGSDYPADIGTIL
jgi:Lrp/AsnC family transcriptional regulator, leucine-responsive regulatory protein